MEKQLDKALAEIETLSRKLDESRKDFRDFLDMEKLAYS
jgi:hypothetical protein